MLTKLCARNFRLAIKIRSAATSALTMNKVIQKQPHIKAPGAAQATALSAAVQHPKFEILPSPVKSFSDKKQYKVIRLENGLTACLISDMVNVHDVASVLSQESDDDSEYESDGSETGLDISDAESTKSEHAEDHDSDDAKTKKAHHHDEVKLAAAALCIGVGSFSDPKEVPGLAHFLEHMVFMGSEKFPQENDFDAFIKKHGGSDNASTDYEMTTFYFECFEKHLHQSMDKFAQFFIAPLMKRESVTREREAIESEFQMAMPSDDYRKEQLLVSLSEKSTPVNSFSWGNLVTLKDNIEDDKLYEMLHTFRKRHYSAHRMTLAVQARLPIEMLESYVVSCFSAIPNNGMQPYDFGQYSETIFNTSEFKRLYFVKPVKDICQVDLTWIMPPLHHMYKSKPHVYVSWLLGHEGKGSLLSYLKKRVWALSLYAGNGESGAEFNSIYASFSVNIALTKEGFNHLEEVIRAVFSYLKLLRNLGPSERIFKEIQSIEEQSFRFEEDESAADKVEELVENMQYYPPQDYLTGSELFFEYNPEAITMVLNHLIAHKMNILVMSSTLPPGVVYDKVEPWFKTQYTYQDIPSEWLKNWSIVEPLPDFALPEPNRFLTEDFTLLPVEQNIPKYPEKIHQTPLIELWYRKDQKFGLPMAYYYYYLLTPLAQESAERACMLQMYSAFVLMNLAENAYPAQIAELSYSVTPCEKGICVKISGYNEKLPMLIELVGKNLREAGDNLTEEMFEAVKERQMKQFYNGFLKPSKLCKDIRLSILQNKYYSLLDRHKAMPHITFLMMKEFANNVVKNLYIQALVQGNVTSATALKTTNNFLDHLNCVSLPPLQRPRVSVNEIPKGEFCCRVKSFNNDSANSVITNYYQSGVLNIKDNVILEFIMLVIEEPLFDVLRTKEQLGYNVYCTIRDTYGILGYSVTVHSQIDKHTTAHVDSRIEAFLRRTSKLLKKMSDKKFLQMKKDLTKVKQVVDVDLEDEVERNWEEIVSGKYMFDRLMQEVKAIEELKISQVKKWWEEHNIYSKKNSFKKLSIQVVGNVPKDKSEETSKEPSKTNVLDAVEGEAQLSVEKPKHNMEKDTAVVHIEAEPPKHMLSVEPYDEVADEVSGIFNDEFALKFIKGQSNGDNQKREDYFIMNIETFKSQLQMFSHAAKVN